MFQSHRPLSRSGWLFPIPDLGKETSLGCDTKDNEIKKSLGSTYQKKKKEKCEKGREVENTKIEQIDQHTWTWFVRHFQTSNQAEILSKGNEGSLLSP